MMELTMAAFLSDLQPSLILQQRDEIPYFHG
jgi:hypothetical protein